MEREVEENYGEHVVKFIEKTTHGFMWDGRVMRQKLWIDNRPVTDKTRKKEVFEQLKKLKQAKHALRWAERHLEDKQCACPTRYQRRAERLVQKRGVADTLEECVQVYSERELAHRQKLYELVSL